MTTSSNPGPRISELSTKMAQDMGALLAAAHAMTPHAKAHAAGWLFAAAAKTAAAQAPGGGKKGSDTSPVSPRFGG
ncbi:MAG TPA: hypothetical protein VJB02_04685 [Coxiellaceae bacterium]|nr:hypothetical protein [Coxiellaceae bacterium]